MYVTWVSLNFKADDVSRYHPADTQTLYTVINTVPPRGKKSKNASRQAFVCKWNTNTWAIEKMKKVGDRGVTTFDIRWGTAALQYSLNGFNVCILARMEDFWPSVLRTLL